MRPIGTTLPDITAVSVPPSASQRIFRLLPLPCVLSSSVHVFAYCSWQLCAVLLYSPPAPPLPLQLVFTFPEDATTSTGAPFWSAPKRFPRALNFDAKDEAHASFVQVDTRTAQDLGGRL